MRRLLLTGALGCAIAGSAMAGERVERRLAVDAGALLSQDDRATYSGRAATPAPERFDLGRLQRTAIKANPPTTDIASFETLAKPGFSSLIASTTSDERLRAEPATREPATANDGGRSIVSDMLGSGRPRRRPDALETSLVFRLDGKPESPAFSIGGGIAAAIWQLLPGN